MTKRIYPRFFVPRNKNNISREEEFIKLYPEAADIYKVKIIGNPTVKNCNNFKKKHSFLNSIFNFIIRILYVFKS